MQQHEAYNLGYQCDLVW